MIPASHCLVSDDSPNIRLALCAESDTVAAVRLDPAGQVTLVGALMSKLA
jgi:hypothetical protein